MKWVNTATNRTKIRNNCLLESFEFKQIKIIKLRKKQHQTKKTKANAKTKQQQKEQEKCDTTVR